MALIVDIVIDHCTIRFAYACLNLNSNLEPELKKDMKHAIHH